MKIKSVSLILGLLAMNVSSAFAEQSEAFQNLWNQYVQSAEKVPLQDACKPTWIKADPSAPFRGTVILHHGFTACSQQYFEWGQDYLSKNGYDVLLTVLPGHGREWQGKKLDKNDLSGFPTRKNWEEQYANFVDETNEIMRASAGEHVLGGLSVGGAVAAQAMLADPDLYQRVLLLSPFFSLSKVTAGANVDLKPWMRTLQKITGGLNREKAKLVDWIANPHSPQGWISKLRQTWGEECEVTERTNGRAGYCQFDLNAISADQKLGEKVLEEATQVKKVPLIQVLAVEQDPTADTIQIRKFVNEIAAATGTKPNLCFFKSNANHSLLSRFDSPKENKYWIPFILKQGSDFVVSGKAVDTHGTYADEANEAACAISE